MRSNKDTKRREQLSRRRILLIGAAPCHVGGIAVHLRRLVAMLSSDYDFDYIDESRDRHPDYFNLRSKRLGEYVRRVRRADVVHVHTGVWMLRVAHVIAVRALGRPVIVTVHRDPNIEGRMRTRITRLVMRLAQKVICVNQRGFDTLRTGKSRYMHLPAFLPQDLSVEEPLPDDITAFVAARRAEGMPVMVSNAWNLVTHAGRDLYGLDMCIDAVARARAEGRGLALVFVLATCTDRPMLQAYLDRIEREGLSDRVLIHQGQASFVRLIELADFVVRPTNTDGDAISVREALFAGRKVVASDVAERPEGTLTFATRSADDFQRCIYEALDRPALSASGRDIQYYKQLYKEIYR